ncbi:MAG: TetR/AcrR family transcriptional regulator [Gaiellaceae bacterium]
MATEAQSERKTLSRRTVVEAALAVGDSEGLEAISLRRLARDLGVTPMALYRYVDSKEGLLSAMIERAFEEFELPAGSEDDWREEMRALGRSFRRLLVAHPGVVALFATHPADNVSQNGARIVEVVLGVLRRAGFPPREAALIESECERFILGTVVLEMSGGPQPCPFNPKAHAHSQEAQAQLALLPVSEFPHLHEALPYFNQCQDPDWAFEFALDLIVGGLERMLEEKRWSAEPEPGEPAQ